DRNAIAKPVPRQNRTSHAATIAVHVLGRWAAQGAVAREYRIHNRHGLKVVHGAGSAFSLHAAADRGVADELRVGDRNDVSGIIMDGPAPRDRASAAVGLVGGKQTVENGQVDTRQVIDRTPEGANGIAAALGRVVREGTLGQGDGDA